MTLVQQIIAHHSRQARVEVGSIVEVEVDWIYAQDGNVPTIARLFELHSLHVGDASRIRFVCDHSVLAPDRSMASRVKDAERFAVRQGIEMVPVGSGISHLLAAEQEWFKPGRLVLGADSHTCTGGAFQSLALGMGATDIACAMAEGTTWLRVPETVRIEVRGCPSYHASPKDVMLHILATNAPEAFLYRSIEWCGEWIESLDAEGAATVANMSVELGAKCCFVSAWKGCPVGMVRIDPYEEDGAQKMVIQIDGLEPQFADGHAISSGRSIDNADCEPVDCVFVGSCANSRLEDIGTVARLLHGRSIAPGLRLVVTPGTRTIHLQALQCGYVEMLVAAGALVTPAGCGPCVGTQGHVPADGDLVVSTMNRNFLGRMGNPHARIVLVSPLVAAATALLGHIPSVAELEGITQIEGFPRKLDRFDYLEHAT
jgi:3-isopropylmalate/(R)-2-methylmalate dehydratase large subunit